jgi:hypothetical protein
MYAEKVPNLRGKSGAGQLGGLDYNLSIKPSSSVLETFGPMAQTRQRRVRPEFRAIGRALTVVPYSFMLSSLRPKLHAPNSMNPATPAVACLRCRKQKVDLTGLILSRLQLTANIRRAQVHP